MSDEPTVQITAEPGVKGQFGRGKFAYQNAGIKVSTPFAVGTAVVLVISISAMVLSGNPKKDEADQASRFLDVEVPQATVTEWSLKIPAVDTTSVVQKVPVGRTKGIIRLLGPEIVSRPTKISIPPGTMGSAALVSGASDGPVKAQLTQPLMVAGETLLDSGTTLVGTGQSGNERLVIRFSKAVLRSGSVAVIDAQAADNSDKIPGVKGSRVGYRALKLAAGVGLHFAGGLSQGLQDSQEQSGAVVTPPSMKNALLNGAAHASIEEGQQMMNEYRSERPVIEIEAGTQIFVLFSDNGSN